MRVMYSGDLDSKDIDTTYNFKCINMPSRKILEMVSKISKDDCTDIVNMLNMINNQGIIEINNKSMFYRVRDIKGESILPFNSMSTSEALFFVSALADKTKTKIFVSNDIMQLTVKTLKTFVNLFRDSEYVTVIFDDVNIAHFYKKRMV